MGLDPLLTPLVSAPVLFVASALLYWVFDRLAISELNSLLVSFGVLVMTIQATSNIWSEDFRRITADRNRYATQSVRIGDFVFPVPTLLAFAAAVVLTVAIHVMLRRTFVGRALRAFAETAPSPPPSASTTGASACCSPAWRASPPPSPACCGR